MSNLVQSGAKMQCGLPFQLQVARTLKGSYNPAGILPCNML